MLNKVVGYWAYIWGTYIRGGGLYSGGGLIFGWHVFGGLRYVKPVWEISITVS
jgi:hypothetical protein